MVVLDGDERGEERVLVSESTCAAENTSEKGINIDGD